MKNSSQPSLTSIWLLSLKFSFCCAFASFIAAVPLLFAQMALSMFLAESQGMSRLVTIAYYLIVFPLAFTALANHFGIRMENEQADHTTEADSHSNTPTQTPNKALQRIGVAVTSAAPTTPPAHHRP